jgi:RNA polymerase sigma factor (sigma-70 family)
MNNQTKTTIFGARDCTSGDLGEADDELLVMAAKSGDSMAFATLSRRYSKMLLRTIYQIVDSWEDAEDVLQETLMKAFLHINRFEGRSRVTTWFTRIAINSALMTLRKRRGFFIAIDATVDDQCSHCGFELYDTRENPEQLYVRNESEVSLRRGIKRLSPHLRDAIELQCDTDCSNKDLAEALGVSIPTVKSRLLRARRVLRRSLQKRLPFGLG